MAKIKDITGQRYGMLVAISCAGSGIRGAKWSCKCDCGNHCVVLAGELKRKRRRGSSCGCRYGSFKHGESREGQKTLEYRAWRNMKNRCQNSKDKAYANYGGRGISVCESWSNSYEAFLADVGRRPEPGYSIDRINNDGNYEPGNIRWATAKEQISNRSCSVTTTISGKRTSVIDAAKKLGVTCSAVYWQIYKAKVELMSLDIIVSRSGSKLIPSSPQDEEELVASISEGEQISARLWRPRSLRHNRWWWSLLDVVSSNLETYDTAAKLAIYLKIRCGLVEKVVINQITGETAIVVTSTRFMAMSQQEFRDFTNRALDVIMTELWGGQGSRIDLMNEVSNRCEIKHRDLNLCAITQRSLSDQQPCQP